MVEGLGKLHRTTKPDGDYVCNGFKMIEGLAECFESQIDDRQTSFDLYNIQT